MSDDTGLAARGTAHAPMLLGLSRGGQLDEAPVPITGIEALNDPESICEGPGGTYFLVTSHSPSREGKTHRARRQLLQLALRGRSLAVIGRLDLSALRGKRTLFGVAGLDPDGRLDIEAVAYRDGALFFGLKSPLTASGAAVVLRLAEPVQALRARHVPEGALSPWVELPLCLDTAGGRVCQGLSDMLFLEDGSLLVAANAPKGGPDDGGGALWWVPEPARPGAPQLLRRFADLRPEGLAFSPGRRGVVVVFDRGRDAPLWAEFPLPVTPAAAGAP